MIAPSVWETRIQMLQNDLETKTLAPAQAGATWQEIAQELTYYESAYRHDPKRRGALRHMAESRKKDFHLR